MVDPEAIGRRLLELERRLTTLRAIAGAGREGFLADDALQTQAERHLQVALQVALDIATHLIAEETAEVPDSYAGAFAILRRMGIVDEDLAAALRRATGLRNILVHGYLDVDPERLWEHLGRVDDLEVFAGKVDGYLRARGL
ncbi:MAG: type VII toxin-antitoxin system HepT family RNase toxin [Actinomycetota bacterium]